MQYSSTPEPREFPAPPPTPSLSPRRSMFKLSTDKVWSDPVAGNSGGGSSSGSNNGRGSSGNNQNYECKPIPMTTFSATSRSSAALPKNRLIASWRVLTGVHPIAAPPPAVSAASVIAGSGAQSAIAPRMASTQSTDSVERNNNSSSDEKMPASNASPSSSSLSNTDQTITESATTSAAATGTPATIAGTSSSFFSPPTRTVTARLSILDTTDLNDLPSYELATQNNTDVATTSNAESVQPPQDKMEQQQSQQERPSQQQQQQQQQQSQQPQQPQRLPQVQVTHAHSPVGKDEIELRVGDIITLTPSTPDYEYNPNASFVRGLNENSGRTGLFPRHCVVPVTTTSVRGGGGGVSSPTAVAGADLAWWREQAVRFESVLRNPAVAADAVSVAVAAAAGSGGDGDKVRTAAGGGGSGIEEVSRTIPILEQLSQSQNDGGIASPLVPRIPAVSSLQVQTPPSQTQIAVVTAATVTPAPVSIAPTVTVQPQRSTIVGGFVPPVRVQSEAVVVRGDTPGDRA
ncbi:hypothetical protein HK100_009862 [Physocladia obscura]|uniref:SH3 domain-containing protein n=1 Tax=Physocladia obscura TaxID=109957 RepID=A0AAD5SPD8_9FUNG|nr:hypothetical protein HK100_009862 [Physocladia obscura]